MKDQKFKTLDGNEAVAHVAYRTNETIAIYPITPASTMGELADAWAAKGIKNIWGTVPSVVEMQSEGGAVGAVHGALQTGCLSTTFTASQGLLLMIPNMYKIAGELTPVVFHVAARSLAAQGLSIFGDHSDVMSARSTGFAMLSSASVQQAQDFALIAQAATLESRVPFLHFFDGFRTSHEIAKIISLGESEMREMLNPDWIVQHRNRALTPDRPFIRGTAQNPDVYFQARETVNPYYLACPTIVQNAMDKFASLTGRKYSLFEYSGAQDAERVMVIMGSGAGAVEETIEDLSQKGEKIGLLKVHLYRPFSLEHMLQALPKTAKVLSVMDRTKEPGSVGEPLYLDIVSALNESRDSFEGGTIPRVIGGRYGLSSKEFTPAMVCGIFEEMKKEKPKNHFTIGICDDVTHTSLDFDPAFSTEDPQGIRAVFYGLGSDGTVGGNKNSIKIIGEETENFAQGYFVYDSKKSGSVTVSHLRFGSKPIRSSYLIQKANFVGCHFSSLLDRIDILKIIEGSGIFLLNTPHGPDEIWDHLPGPARKHLVEKKVRFYIIDAHQIAMESGLGNRIGTVMQTCFFAISQVLPYEEAVAAIKRSIEKTYGKLGEIVVQKNFKMVDSTLKQLQEVQVPEHFEGGTDLLPPVDAGAPEFVQKVTAKMIAGDGDLLPVSALPVDGTYPSGTSQWEKRNIAAEIPVWDQDLCIQCGKCVLVCPHAVIRGKVYDESQLSQAPSSFKSTGARGQNLGGQKFTIQVSPDDCTGCRLCVEVCPVKSKSDASHKAINMMPQPPLREAENQNWKFFSELPEVDRTILDTDRIKDVQLMQPLFEFSGACAGCGETPYLKLLSQLFGDRMMIANATGCSSIYGGNLPTTPWTHNKEGRGPAWSNSLFEDNAEFGLGMRVALDKQNEYARELLTEMQQEVGEDLVREILNAPQSNDKEIGEQRKRIVQLKEKLASLNSLRAKDLLLLADVLVKKSVWIIGGDGWGYDIGFGGLDHVLASGRKVNVLILDTEVYSNTGGQMSKSTPRGAVAKFAAGGKSLPKKDLAMMAMTYGTVFVARIAMGSNDVHTLKVLQEAEAYQGTSLIIAYSHCIAHGYNLVHGMEQQKKAVQSGYWPLMRYNPDLLEKGANPMILDSKPPSLPLEKYIYNEARYNMLAMSNKEAAKVLLEEAREDVRRRWRAYENLAGMKMNEKPEEPQ